MHDTFPFFFSLSFPLWEGGDGMGWDEMGGRIGAVDAFAGWGLWFCWLWTLVLLAVGLGLGLWLAWLVGWLVGWLAGWLVACLPACLLARLVGFLVGCLLGSCLGFSLCWRRKEGMNGGEAW